MAEITDAGIQPDGLTGFVGRLNTEFKGALGQDLNVDSETPQGQMIGALAIVLTEAEELAVYVANGLNLNSLKGRQVSDWGTLLSQPLIEGERSTVTATLSGTSGTIIPKGSRARTSAGAIFATDERVILPAAGSADVLMRAVEIGPVVAAAGSLTRIVDARAGWTGITNALAARLGRNLETDAEYKRRYTAEVSANARDAVEAIRARVREVDGVTDAYVDDNQTASDVVRQGITIEAGATLVVVDGGADEDVTRAIALTKPAGGPTSGNRTVAFEPTQGPDVDINFRRVDPIPIEVSVTLTAGPAFPSNGLALMRQNLVQWFNGEWPVAGPGLFNQEGVGIGESIDEERLKSPLNAVPGHTLGTVTVQRVSGLLASIAVNAGGSSYTSAPTVVIAGGSGATAVAVISGGVVVRIDITDRGDGTLMSAPAITFMGGGGTGAMATATISTSTLGTPNLDQRFTLDSESVTLALT